MPEGIRKNLCQYYTQSWQEAEEIFDMLYQARGDIAQALPVQAKKFVTLIEHTAAYLGTPDIYTFEPIVNVLRLLDRDVITAYVRDVTNLDLFVEVLKQVYFLSIACGVPIPVQMYSPMELENIASSEIDYYDDATLAYTLRKMYEGVDVPGSLALVGNLLFAGETSDVQQNYDWETMFLRSLMFHVMYQHLPLVDVEQQVLLLKQHLYSASVIGISIHARWTYVVDIPFHKELKQSYAEKIGATLYDNIEMVPTNTNCGEWKRIVEIYKNYQSQTGQQKRGGYPQEEFIEKLYNGQKHRDVFRSWLRNVFNVYNTFTAL